MHFAVAIRGAATPSPSSGQVILAGIMRGASLKPIMSTGRSAFCGQRDHGGCGFCSRCFAFFSLPFTLSRTCHAGVFKFVCRVQHRSNASIAPS